MLQSSFDFCPSESLCMKRLSLAKIHELYPLTQLTMLKNIFDFRASESLLMKRLGPATMHTFYPLIQLTYCENMNKIRQVVFEKWYKTVLTFIPQNLFV